MTRRRLDPVLTLIDVLLRIQNTAANRLLGGRCPICRDRYHFLDGHVATEHHPWEK